MTTPSHQTSGTCPAHGAASACPASDLAAEFDPFTAPYQADPAEALRWSRDQAPVFFAPKLGYWVVTRYDDIKAVFRDNRVYSPRNVLEKITPSTPEAMEVLKSYGFALNRTLVNEDEPAHMERRRVLMDHFLPENLAPKEAMIRRLTRDAMDKFIDIGRVDLVEAMLYEVPLTVALHFLGVPEDEIETLRSFSVAHAVNTWGKPTPDQQIGVAHGVGKFWQYAGDVIEKMRAEPNGQGWMHHTIRMNAAMPEIVTDSYVHSMMMAIIVAAHETTSLASANMIKTMLSHPQAWADVCADPSLIPNAVEECLRYRGSVIAWRRETTTATQLGGVDLPEGAKLLIVQASGNQDERHFEGGDAFDIYRDNAQDHLTFGYGSHQCMGKNIGRMEMRIFLEELTRRLPHLQLAEQEFHYLPTTSFWGPDKVIVEWDPAQNPERQTPAVLSRHESFPVGAHVRKDIARRVTVSQVRHKADRVIGLTLQGMNGRPLPYWSAGAHIELVLDGYDRKYSLCGSPDVGTYEVAILREDAGRGGSKHIHDTVKPGMVLKMRGPSNLFRLNEAARHSTLIAGGIGITPIIAMADRLKALGHDYAIHYAGQNREGMAFLDRLSETHADRLTIYANSEGTRADLAALVAGLPDGGELYACGPARMISQLEDLTENHPDGTLHFEHFSSKGSGLNPADEHPFTVDLLDSDLTITVAADETLLDALHAAGIDVASDCCEGLCGSCEVAVVAGDIDHRDMVLTRAERGENGRMMACCSRSKAGGRIKLAL